MDAEEDDIHMSDMPLQSSSRTFIPSSRTGVVASAPPNQHGSFNPISQSGVLNGFQDSHMLSKTSPSEGGSSNPATLLNGPSNHDTALAPEFSTGAVRPNSQNRELLDAFLADLDLDESDPPEPFRSELATGYCYDVRMRYHCELEPPENRRDYHPEDPRRIFSIYRELCVAGLIDDKLLNKGSVVSRPLKRIDVREADESEIELVHGKSHWDIMKLTKGLLRAKSSDNL